LFRIVYKFQNFIEISSIRFLNASLNPSRGGGGLQQIISMMHSIVLYSNNNLAHDLTTLKNDIGLWKKIKTIPVDTT